MLVGLVQDRAICVAKGLWGLAAVDHFPRFRTDLTAKLQQLKPYSRPVQYSLFIYQHNVHFEHFLGDSPICVTKVAQFNNKISCMTQVIDRLEKWLPRKRLDIFGKDSLMKTSLPYYLLTLIPFIGFISQNPNPYIYIAITYAGFPIFDEIFSLDSRNPNNQERIQLEKNDSYFRMTLYTGMILSWANFFKFLNLFSTADITLETIPYVVGVIFIVSNLYAAQFAISHEVMHKPGKFYRILGTLHMSKLYYMHFTYHHLYRHHYDVATPMDPSTSKKGENVYKFIVRCITYSWLGVYNDEKKQGKTFFGNYAVLSILASLGFMFAIYYFYGLQALVLHSLMALGSVIYLEAINYIEHYGLERKMLPNGQYEKVTILHSWNAPHRFTNYFFFKLQRHSDHHQNSSKPFQTLLSLEESPFLPHGYTLMILMSFFPKIWFKVMDPLAEAYGKLTLSQNGKIDPEVIEKSVTQTRKFLIDIALASILLMLFSLIK